MAPTGCVRFGDWVALSDPCDALTASLIAREVSDGVIAPGYSEEALEILKTKRKGSYNVVAIDPDYVPAQQEEKQVYGVTFQQGRNNFKIDGELLNHIVTQNKDLPEGAKRDLIVSLITLKYTQSNSVCFAYDGQAIGVGAGQQSRIHCTRLAGSKADTWFLRQHPKTLALPFKPDLGRPNRDNVIDGYINGNEEDVCAEGIWQNYFYPASGAPDRGREAGVSVHPAERLPGLGCLLPLPGQHQAGPSSPVCATWPSPAVPFGMTWSSKNATRTTWLWPLLNAAVPPLNH